MKILCVAATKIELDPLLQDLGKDPGFINIQDLHFQNDTIELEFLVTGIGILPTAYNLTAGLKMKTYDLVLNIGIAGSFKEELESGTVVRVSEDAFADMGVQDNSGLITMFEAGFWDPQQQPFERGKLVPHPESKWLEGLDRLPVVKGITVCRLTEIPGSMMEKNSRFGAAIETMEGAAFYYVTMMEGYPAIQVRAISNRVGDRDRSKWDIPMATQKLADVVVSYIQKLV